MRIPVSPTPAAPVAAPLPTPPPAESPVNETRLVDTFVRLVQIPGPTYEERPVADYLKGEFQALGLAVEEDDAAEKVGSNSGNLIVRVPGNTPGAPKLLFASHMDTARLAVGVKPQVRDGVITSDGRTALGGDNRGGVAEILEAVREVKESGLPHGDVELLFTVAEEAGLEGARALDASKISPKYAYAVDAFLPNQIYIQGRHLLGDGEITAEDVHRFKTEGPNAPIVPPSGTDLSPAEREILDFTAKAMQQEGLTPEFRRIEYAGTDAIALRRKGFNAISLGAGEDRPHTRQERMEVKSLVNATRLIKRLILNAAMAAVPGPAGLAGAVAARA